MEYVEVEVTYQIMPERLPCTGNTFQSVPAQAGSSSHVLAPLILADDLHPHLLWFSIGIFLKKILDFRFAQNREQLLLLRRAGWNN